MLNKIEMFLKSYEQIVDKVLTILATILGGVLTYWGAVKINKESDKRRDMIETRNQILIPFCTALEETKTYLKESQKPLNFNENTVINNLLKYSKADKRIFLDKEIRKKLTDMNEKIVELENIISAETRLIFYEFQQNVKLVLKENEILKDAISFEVYYSANSEQEIRNQILSRESSYPIYLITKIQIAYNYDPMDYDVGTLVLDDRFYDDIWFPIQMGLEVPCTVSEDMAVSLLKSLEKNKEKAIDIYIDKVENTEAFHLYTALLEDIDYMYEKTIFKIDKITDFIKQKKNKSFARYSKSGKIKY